MLARNNRLTASKDIMRVLRTGQRAGVGPFMVYALPNRSSTPQVAHGTVIISKKVDKRAVVRNRCRRKVREALRLLLPNLKPGFDILVYIKQDISTSPSQVVEQDIQRGCQKIGVLSKL